MEWTIWTVILSIADISIVAYAIYRILLLLKDTRAMQLLKGVLILLILYVISGWLHLTTVNWILGKSWSVILLGIAIIFQPELRSVLERLGRGRSFFQRGKRSYAQNRIVSAIEETLAVASENKIGVLLVLEGHTGLQPQIDTGVVLDSRISSELLLNLFFKNAPLHDGAVILRGNRIAAAGCIMPLTTKEDIDSMLGTRHRAAIGISEVCDALVFVVSEETGIISVVRNGNIQRGISEKNRKRYFDDFYGAAPKKPREAGGGKKV